MKITLEVGREFDYDTKYSITVRSAKDLPATDYTRIVASIKQIQAVLDPIIDAKFEKAKVAKK